MGCIIFSFYGDSGWIEKVAVPLLNSGGVPGDFLWKYGGFFRRPVQTGAGCGRSFAWFEGARFRLEDGFVPELKKEEHQ